MTFNEEKDTPNEELNISLKEPDILSDNDL